MDKEVLDMIRDRLLHIEGTIKSAVDQLDVETFESRTTGKTIALDFDDTDLTNVQVEVDVAAGLLQELSAEIATFLMD